MRRRSSSFNTTDGNEIPEHSSRTGDEDSNDGEGNTASKRGMGWLGATATCLNVSMGTGWLTLPYAFYRSGIIPAVILTFLFAFLTNMGKDYFIESMVRCEAVAQETTDQISATGLQTMTSGVLALSSNSGTDSCIPASEEGQDVTTTSQHEDEREEGGKSPRGGRGRGREEEEEGKKAPIVVGKHDPCEMESGRKTTLESSTPPPRTVPRSRQSPPQYEITNRRWELTRCANFLLSPWACLAVGAGYSVLIWGMLLEFCQIFSVSMASIAGAPMFSLPSSACADPNTIVFGSACYPAYASFLAFFTMVVIILALLGLREMKEFQIAMSCMRFFVLLLMCFTLLADPTLSLFKDGLTPIPDSEVSSIWANPSGIGFSIGAIFFALGNCDVAPSVGQAMRRDQRRLLPYCFLAATIALSLLYIFVAVVASYTLHSNGYVVFATINNAWNKYGGEDPSWWQYLVRYVVVLFAPLDVLSTAPVRAIALVSNIAGAVFRNHEGKGELGELSLGKRTCFYLVSLVLPFIIAFFVTSVAQTVSFLGILTIMAQYIFPGIFVYAAVMRCRKVFGLEQARAAGHYSLFYSTVPIYWIYLIICGLILAFEFLAMLGDYGVTALAFG